MIARIIGLDGPGPLGWGSHEHVLGHNGSYLPGSLYSSPLPFIQECNLLELHSKEVVGLHWKALNKEEDSRPRLRWPWRQVGSIAEGFAWSMCPYNWWDGVKLPASAPLGRSAHQARRGAERSLGALQSKL